MLNFPAAFNIAQLGNGGLRRKPVQRCGYKAGPVRRMLPHSLCFWEVEIRLGDIGMAVSAQQGMFHPVAQA
jgi:hypothetical protein